MKGVYNIIMQLRIDVLLLLTLMTGVFIQSVLFLMNVPCSCWPMWIAFCVISTILALQSRKRLVGFFLLTGFAFVLTACTFSYTGTDALVYHFPMQDLLRNGWNPVYQATFEDFHQVIGNAHMSEIHTLFLPRLIALCGALVASSTNLFIADSFLNYALLFTLCTTSYEFSRRVICDSDRGSLINILFAFAIAFTTKFTAFLSGYIDYSVYAATLIMIFAACMYWKDRRSSDLILTILAIVIASLAKSTGLVVVALFVMASMPFFYRDRNYWIGGISAAVLILIIGFSPLITSTIHYGCPLYPTMSFSAAHPAIDITNDFTGNADALKMGYLARTCFAWVSPTLTTKLCAFFYGQPNFDPVFTVCGGVAGFGTVFRFLLGASVISLIFSQKNVITCICAFLFLTTLVTPLKYVGFSRYFLQVWAIPPLAIFNLVSNPIWKDHDALWSKSIRYGLMIVPVLIAALCAVRSLAFYGRTIGLETDRQTALSTLKVVSDRWCVGQDNPSTYTLVRRMAAEDMTCKIVVPGVTNDLPRIDYYGQFAWASIRDAKAGALTAEESYPIANSVGELFSFPWRKSFSSWPHILWNKKEDDTNE